MAIAALLTTSMSAQFNPNYRNVFWIHGIQGDVNSLKPYALYFGERYQINSYHLSYPSNMGYVYGAYQLSALSIGSKVDDVVVAHSMGGLVSRQLFKDYPNKRFGGFITLNSPHLGAEFANSFDNGKVKQLFDKSVNEGFAGYSVMGSAVGSATRFHPNVLNQLDVYESYRNIRDNINIISGVASVVLLNPLIYLGANYLANLVSAETIKLAVEKGIKANVQMAIGLAAMSAFGARENPNIYPYSKDDLKPNSAANAALNSFSMNCEKIAIATYATYPAGIKFLGSTISYMSQDNPQVGDIKNNVFLKLTQAIIWDAELCQAQYSDLFRLNSWLLLGTTNSYYRERRDAFGRQANYWRNGFERAYQECLGSIYYTTETFTITELEWVCDGSAAMQAGSPFIQATVKDYDPNCWQWVTRTYTNTIENIHPNDGIVTLPSQHGLSGARKITLTTTTSGIDHVPGIDHELTKRSKAVRDYLELDIFEIPGYFKLIRK